MMFPEKLYQLRRQNNLTQEGLAERLCTTRQAVSKWETGQGLPETEKLLQLSTLFGVPVDYLLKDTPEEEAGESPGYYVSREMAEGYLASQQRWSRRFAGGLAVLILSIVPFLKLQYGDANPMGFLVLVLAGGYLALRGLLSQDKKYRVLAREPLLFDPNYLKVLQGDWRRLRGRYRAVFVLALPLLLASLWLLTYDGGALAKDFTGGVPGHLYTATAFLALSAVLLVCSGATVRGYELLAENEDRARGLWFRLRRKLRKRADRLLG